jgi:hypothetical protein
MLGNQIVQALKEPAYLFGNGPEDELIGRNALLFGKPLVPFEILVNLA